MLKKSYPEWYHPAVSVLGRLRLETHSLMESLAYREIFGLKTNKKNREKKNPTNKPSNNNKRNAKRTKQCLFIAIMTTKNVTNLPTDKLLMTQSIFLP